MRRSALKRGKRRAREPGEDIWKLPRTGRCAICGRRGSLLRHHVVYEQHVRREGGDPWDLRNSLDVGRYCSCHRLQHASGHARKPISRAKLRPVNVEFAVRLLGEDRWEDYLARYYAP